MSATETVPVTIAPEAAARIGELGIEDAVGRMLQWSQRSVAGLSRLEVILEPAYDTGDDPYLTLRAFVARYVGADEAYPKGWSRWLTETFPPEVCRHVALAVLTVTDGPDSFEAAVERAEVIVPVSATAEARERLDELGMSGELRAILDHVGRSAPAGLRAIEIESFEGPDGSGPTVEVVGVHRPEDYDAASEFWRGLWSWKHDTFSPERCFHIAFSCRSDDAHEG